MTRDEALEMLADYSQCARTLRRDTPTGAGPLREMLESVGGMRARFPMDGSERKAMRWLGYAQGVLVALGIFTLNDVKDHSRRRRV